MAAAAPSAGQLGLVKPIWRKQRTLVFCSRGTTAKNRHLMNDLRVLLPHSKKDVKLDSKDRLTVINEIAEMKNCNNCIFFETRKRQDLYLWLAKTPNGPSAKFLVVNVHTMDELKMTGNCLRGSRPLLSFDPAFDGESHLRLIKTMLSQAFGTPNRHPKSKPFFDHVYNFSYADGRVWFRNFQITWGDKKKGVELNEIGPRFVLQPIRIFSGSFGGVTLYQNPEYVSPNELRALAKKEAGEKYRDRTADKLMTKKVKEDSMLPEDEIDDVFKS